MKKRRAIFFCGIALIFVAIIMSHIVINNESNNKKLLYLENNSSLMKLNLGDEFFLKDLIADTSDIKDVYFENGDIFSIDDGYVINTQHLGIDTLVVNYKNNSYEKYKFISSGKSIDIKNGETLDYNKIGINENDIENVSADNDLVLINNNIITAVNEGTSIITVTYKDGSSEYISLSIIEITSNASTAHKWTFMCSETEKCAFGNYGNFTTIAISTEPSFKDSNLISYWGCNEMPTNDGYYFDGFYTELNGKGTKVVDHDGNIISDDLKTRKVYAYFMKSDCQNPHTITYDCQGGKSNDNGITCGATLHACTSVVGNYIGNNAKDSFPIREGYYTFNGFYTEPNGQGIRVTDNTGKYIFDDLKSKNIYAYWTNKNCTSPHAITYDCQGGKSNGNGITCAATLNICTSVVGSYIGNNEKDSFPIKDGYIFNGFYTEPNGQGIKVTDNTGKYINDDLKSRKIYAYWSKTDCSNPHTITYDCQGGRSNGNGMTCNATLHTCTSTVGDFIGNNETDSFPIRDGYIFNGFYTEANGKGTKVTDNTGKYVSDDLNSKKIYAYWSKTDCSNPHTITYDCQGGKSNGNGITCNATLHTCTSTVGDYIGNNEKDSFPIKDGYIFNGFYTEANGKGTKVTDNTGKYVSDDLNSKKIYAYWTKPNCSNPHTITYDCQGGKSNGNGITCNATLHTCTSTVGDYIGNNEKDSFPIREGYLFNGFYTEPNGKGKKVTDNTGKYINDDLNSKVVYAYWSKPNCSNPHTITYDCQGGKSNGNGITCSATLHTCTSTVGDYIGNNEKDSFPIREGYLFNGFYTEPNGKGTQITDKTGKYINDDLNSKVVYAYWAKDNCPNPHTITYDCQGGDGMVCFVSQNLCTNTVGSYVANNVNDSILLKDGYIFNGFYTEPNGKGTQVTDKTGKYISDDLKSRKIYAYWIKDSTIHNITFSCSEGVSCWGPIGTSGSFINESLVKDFEFTLPKRDGYIFNGFYTKPNGNGIKVIDSKGTIIYDDKKSILVYDYWTPIKIEIIFHRNKNKNDSKIFKQIVNYTDSNKCFGCNIGKKGYLMRNSNSGFGSWTYKDNLFLGWSRSSSSNIVTYSGNSIISSSFIENVYNKKYQEQKNSKVIDLYAVWVPKMLTVNLTFNGGINKDKNITNNKVYLNNYSKWCYNIKCSNVISKIKPPTKNGYIFVGFYTKSNGGKQVVSNTGYINKNNLDLTSKTIYLYARWTKK